MLREHGLNLTQVNTTCACRRFVVCVSLLCVCVTTVRCVKRCMHLRIYACAVPRWLCIGRKMASDTYHCTVGRVKKRQTCYDLYYPAKSVPRTLLMARVLCTCTSTSSHIHCATTVFCHARLHAHAGCAPVIHIFHFLAHACMPACTSSGHTVLCWQRLHAYLSYDVCMHHFISTALCAYCTISLPAADIMLACISCSLDPHKTFLRAIARTPALVWSGVATDGR